MTPVCFFYLLVVKGSKSLYQGPGGVWCDVDVVEFSYFGAPEPAPKEQLYTEIVDDLRGGDPCIGSGSQVFFIFLSKHTNFISIERNY